MHLFEVAVCLGASALIMLIIWQSFDFKIVPIFAMLVCGVEFLIQIKYRMLMDCPRCGFDPYLYRQDVNKCVQKVKDHLEKQRLDPLALMSSKPKLKLPFAKIKQEGKANSKMESKLGSVVRKSKQGKNLDVRL